MLTRGSWFGPFAGSLVGMLAGVGAGPAAQAQTPAAPPVTADPLATDAERARLPFAELRPVLSPPPQRDQPLAPLSDRARLALARAQTLRAERRYTEAAIELEKALRSAADDPRIHRALALTRWEAGDVQRVREHIDATLRSAGDAAGHYLLGRLAARRFDNAEAIRQFRLTLLCPPDAALPGIVALTQYHLAETLMSEGYLTAAIELYEQFDASANQPVEGAPAELGVLRRANPRAGQARAAVARALLGDYAAAADQFRAAFAPQTMEAADVRQYAEYLLRADRIEAALTALRAAVVDDPAALALLREAYARRTQPEALVAELRKLVKAHPDRRHLLMALADTLREQDRPDEALELLRARAAGASANAALRWAVFDALAEQGDVAAALAEATAAVRAQPRAASDAAIRINELAAQADALAAPKLGDDFAAAFVSALYAEARGELDAALGDFARAVALAPDFLPARVRLARMHLARYAWDDAIAAARPEDRAPLEDTRLETILGKAYSGLNQPDAAVEHLRKALRLNRLATEAMVALAELYRDNGQADRALRQLQALIDADPRHERGRELLFHAYLADGDNRAAARQLEELRRLGATPTCIARCVAFMEFNPNAPDTARFRATLQEAIDAYRPDAATLHLIGLAYLQERRHEEAIAALEEAARLEPDHRESAEALVQAYRAHLDFDRALAQRRMLMARYPNQPAWAMDEIELLRILQRFDEVVAIATRRLAGAEDREAAQLREVLIMTHLSQEDYPAALVLLESEWADDRTDIFNLRRLIMVHQLAENHARALELIEYWQREVDRGLASGGTGMVWRALPKTQQGRVLELLLEAVEKNPERDGLHLSLIELLLEMKDFEGALELARANASASRYPEAYQEFEFSALSGAGRIDEAIAQVNERLLDSGNSRITSTVIRDRLARLLIRAGRHAQAARDLNRWLNAATDKDERLAYLNLLSFLHQDTGNHVEALQALERLFEIDGGGPGASNDLGYSLADAGQDLVRAERLIRQAVADSPRNSAYLDSLGWVRYKRGDFAAARLWLTRARRAGDGRDPVVCDHLGDACWRLGLADEARKWWRESVEFARERLDSDWPMQADQRTLDSVEAKLAAVAAGEEPVVALFVAEQPAGEESNQP
jgi:tetratricopeptide (TPR) repeat protein